MKIILQPVAQIMYQIKDQKVKSKKKAYFLLTMGPFTILVSFLYGVWQLEAEIM